MWISLCFREMKERIWWCCCCLVDKGNKLQELWSPEILRWEDVYEQKGGREVSIPWLQVFVAVVSPALLRGICLLTMGRLKCPCFLKFFSCLTAFRGSATSVHKDTACRNTAHAFVLLSLSIPCHSITDPIVLTNAYSWSIPTYTVILWNNLRFFYVALS